MAKSSSLVSILLTLSTLGVSVSHAVLPSSSQLVSLESTLCGEVVLRNDSEYEEGNKLDNEYHDDVLSWAIIYCECEQDVVNAVNFISWYQDEFDGDLQFAVRSGGHSFGGYSKCDDCIIVDTSRLDDITFNKDENTIIMGPGVKSTDLVSKFGEFNGIMPSPAVGTVCLGGYTLGGGITPAVRSLGLLADYLVGARIVLADGEVVEVGEHKRKRKDDRHSGSSSSGGEDGKARGKAGNNDRELLYALRGGGLTVGIVTEYTFKTVSLSDNDVGMYSGTIEVVIDIDTFGSKAKQLLKAYRDVAFVDSGEIYENLAYNPSFRVLTSDFTYVCSVTVAYYGTDYLSNGPGLVEQHFYDEIQERVNFTLPDLSVSFADYVNFTVTNVAARTEDLEAFTAAVGPSRLLFDAHNTMTDSFIENFIDMYVTVAYPAFSSYVFVITIATNWHNGAFSRVSTNSDCNRKLTSYFPNRDSDGYFLISAMGVKAAYSTDALVSGVLKPLLDNYAIILDDLLDELDSNQVYLNYVNLYQTNYTNYFGRHGESRENQEIVRKIQHLKQHYDENDFFDYPTSIPVNE